MKFVVMRKPVLENREDSILQYTPWNFWTIRSQSQGTESIVITAKILQEQKPSDLIATLVEEKKPVVADKYDFECRDESKVMAINGNFGPSRFWCKKKTMNRFVDQIFSTIFKLLAETKMEDTKHLVADNWEFQ